jgi:hypothetical protein
MIKFDLLRKQSVWHANKLLNSPIIIYNPFFKLLYKIIDNKEIIQLKYEDYEINETFKRNHNNKKWLIIQVYVYEQQININ